MTDQEWQENVNRLVIKNNGWFVSEGPKDYKVGQIIPIITPAGTVFNAVVMGPATEAEARSDCEFLGHKYKGHPNPGRPWVKVMVG